MSKQTMTKSQLREAINGLGPLAPDWLVEALEDFIELQEAHKNLLAIHAEDAYHLDEARAKHDEPVGVARTNAMLKQGDTFCVFELGSVPEGTKLYAHPKQEQTVFEQLKTQMKNDADYAWSWHCNIAMVIYDAKLASHTIANLCAAQVMRILFDIEPAHDLPKQSPIDERAEFERWANENKGGEPLQLGGGGTYPNPFANAAFEAWQARAKLEKMVPELLKECGEIVQ